MASESLVSLGGDTAIEQREPSISSLPSTHVTIIQCYAKGRPAPLNANEDFATFLARKVRERSHKWRFSPEALPTTHKAHLDIFLVQARAELAANDSEADEHFQDLRAIIDDEISGFFEAENTKPLLILFLAPRAEDERPKSFTGAKLLGGFTGAGKDSSSIARGEPDITEAMLEPLVPLGRLTTACGIGLAVYGALKLGNYLMPEASSTPETAKTCGDPQLLPPTKSSETIKESATKVKDDFEVASGYVKLVEQASVVPFKENNVESIAQGRLQLRKSCSQAKEDLDDFNETMNALFSSNNTYSNTDITLSTQENIEVAELLMKLSNSMQKNKESLDGLIPLLDKKYSKQKKYSHGVTAGVAGCAALYVAAVWAATAVVLPAAVPFWGANWILGHGMASLWIGGTGTVTAGVCGSMSYSNSEQCKMRDDVRVNEVRFRKARNQFLLWLVIDLIGEEQPQCVKSSMDLPDIYKKMGIQTDLVVVKAYRRGAIKTAWEELSHAATQYLGSCDKLIS
ncbi:hypothetical protein EDB80DRAFT_884896 [Ilyonectria destructans]|nr:hypothetical protein EDB80DRAFT_884896 [Ilyonectria destructans]